MGLQDRDYVRSRRGRAAGSSRFDAGLWGRGASEPSAKASPRLSRPGGPPGLPSVVLYLLPVFLVFLLLVLLVYAAPSGWVSRCLPAHPAQASPFRGWV